jgi:hypothetical protein
MPGWRTKGITYLFPKSEDTKELNYYRLITFLSTVYRMLTGIFTRRISSHLEEHGPLIAGQNGYHSGSYECKDELLI